MTSTSGQDDPVYSRNPGIFIKPHGVHLPDDIDQMESQEIMPILQSLDPQGTWIAGHRFAEVGQALNDIATRLARHGDRLAEHWKGSGGAGAMRTFQEMHDYAARLAAQANQTGEALKWLGNDVMPHYKSLAAPHEMPGVSKTAANHAARTYLKSFSEHVVTANNHIPSHIVGMAPAKTAAKKSPVTAPPTTTAPPTAQQPPPGPGPGQPPAVPVSPVHSPSPVTTAPPGGSLQGVTAPSAPAPSGAAVPGAVTPPGGPAGVPVLPGSGTGGTMFGDSLRSAAGDPAEAGSSASDGASGNAGAADGAGAARAEAAAGEDGARAMPMMGGAGGQSEQDRQREAWMREDTDIWGVPSDDGTPPLLG